MMLANEINRLKPNKKILSLRALQPLCLGEVPKMQEHFFGTAIK
jgi:hypothetical protein